MEKFPHFNFFPTDWIAGTAEMSAEQQGAFINLLAYAWEQDPPASLPENEATLARWAGLTVQRWRKIGEPIRKRLELGEDGRFRNPKQYRVYLEMCQFRERRSKAGQMGNDKRWGSQRDRNANRNAIAEGSLPVPIPNGDANASPSSSLRAYLGELSESVERMDRSADHGSSWESGIHGLYGPNGTDTEVWRIPSTGSAITETERHEVLAKAIDRYAAEGKKYNGILFRRFVERARDERNGNTNTRATGTDGRGKTNDQSSRRQTGHGG